TRLTEPQRQSYLGVRRFGLVKLPVELAEVIVARRWLPVAPIADQSELFDADTDQSVHGLLRIHAETPGVVWDKGDAKPLRLARFAVNVPLGDTKHRPDE